MKRVLAISLSIMMVLSLAACGGNEPAATTAAPTAAPAAETEAKAEVPTAAQEPAVKAPEDYS